jgi:8-oxo-dGTP pyrophosphatase MutT (NUDIX family)
MGAERMPQDLAVLLDRHEASARDEAVWSGGTIRLRIASYLSDAFVPLAYVTSVRTVVLRGDEVLTMRNAYEWHVLPGGRRHPGETPEQTLRREIWEEAGLLVETPAQLGFMHLHHVSPQPPGYAYPYPDFLWLVYAVEAATAPHPDRVADDYEQEALFRSIVDAEELELSIQSRLYLDAARRIRRG